ncbi:unnamed protein product [Lactuca saligna]|uniref:Uncharacterized protein n=1 Tax=Lactuca saligna TaxID=75948 RepID=A0AA35ZFS0_LACSI|nr:unnamed protein product [Lactuca saligna]
MVMSSEEETKSYDVGLRPRKMCNTVSVAKLLGGIGDVLGYKLSMLGQKEKVVVPSSLKKPHSMFIGSLQFILVLVPCLGGILGVSGDSSPSNKPSMGSLLSKYIVTLDWSNCAPPPATMKLLVAQSGACMPGELQCVAAQTSTLMVVAANRVLHFGINEVQLKTLQDDVASLREELRDLEAERPLLSDQNCIVAYEKTALEDHVETLQGQV